MKITPEQCEIKETYVPGTQYSLMLLYGKECVAVADLSVTVEYSIDDIYPDLYFNRLKVKEQYRGMGLGSFTLDKVLEFARMHNFSIINMTNPYGGLDLKQLTDFYIRHGFKQIKDRILFFEP